MSSLPWLGSEFKLTASFLALSISCIFTLAANLTATGTYDGSLVTPFVVSADFGSLENRVAGISPLQRSQGAFTFAGNRHGKFDLPRFPYDHRCQRSIHHPPHRRHRKPGEGSRPIRIPAS
jgi:hypothetical protein